MKNWIARYEQEAKRILNPQAFDYIAGGAGDESGLARNVSELQSIRLLNRVLRGNEVAKTEITLLGRSHATPIFIAPTAYHFLVHKDSEVEMARAAKALDTIMVLSTLSSQDMETVQSSTGADLWFQLYFFRDRGLTQAVVERAASAHFQAIVLTVDTPVTGIRYRDRMNDFKFPANYIPANILPTRPPHFTQSGFKTPSGQGLRQYFVDNIKRSLSWKDVEWLQSITKLPIILKGILNPEDAKIAAQQKIPAIVVSNHGGRQLDAFATAAEALPRIRDAVGSSVEILADGGIRSGSDVIRYLCLGANAVLVGRPAVWALAVDGAAGVQKIFLELREELETGMTILGAGRVADLNREWIYRAAAQPRASGDNR